MDTISMSHKHTKQKATILASTFAAWEELGWVQEVLPFESGTESNLHSGSGSDSGSDLDLNLDAHNL